MMPEAASTADRRIFLLRSFCDEITSATGRLILRYLSAVPERTA